MDTDEARKEHFAHLDKVRKEDIARSDKARKEDIARSEQIRREDIRQLLRRIDRSTIMILLSMAICTAVICILMQT